MLVDWVFALDVLPMLARAAIITVEVTVLSFAVALVLGMVLAVFRMARSPWIAWPAAGVVEFIRSTPVLIQIYFIFFVLPNFGLMLPAFTTGILALGLHYSAYCSEAYRAGLDNVPRGQDRHLFVGCHVQIEAVDHGERPEPKSLPRSAS